MTPIQNEQLIEALNWRYATKQFDASKNISASDWDTLEESLLLSPSSFGLQPWKFLVITNPQLREKLKPVSWNQTQVTDASHHVVFAIPNVIDVTLVDRFLERAAEVRGTSVESMAAYRGLMAGFVDKANKEGWVEAWATRQVYIALGNLMTSAALLGIDACPMEGLDPAKYDEILGLKAKGLKTVVACALGYRAAGDKYASLAKVRFPKDQIFEYFT